MIIINTFIGLLSPNVSLICMNCVLEPINKKPRLDSKPKSPKAADEKSEEVVTPKKESSEMQEVMASLRSDLSEANDEDKSQSSGRQQRNRRKPKRWQDDEVEVDFSGELGILAEQKQRPENDENVIQENNKEPKSDEINDKKTKVFENLIRP